MPGLSYLLRNGIRSWIWSFSVPIPPHCSGATTVLSCSRCGTRICGWSNIEQIRWKRWPSSVTLYVHHPPTPRCPGTLWLVMGPGVLRWSGRCSPFSLLKPWTWRLSLRLWRRFWAICQKRCWRRCFWRWTWTVMASSPGWGGHPCCLRELGGGWKAWAVADQRSTRRAEDQGAGQILGDLLGRGNTWSLQGGPLETPENWTCSSFFPSRGQESVTKASDPCMKTAVPPAVSSRGLQLPCNTPAHWPPIWLRGFQPMPQPSRGPWCSLRIC